MEEIVFENSSPPKKKRKLWIIITASCVVFILLLILLDICATKNEEHLTKENYNKISVGMTYEEVVETLDGHEGEFEYSTSEGYFTLEYYCWENYDSSKVIYVVFNNGLVYSKSSMGLK